MFEKKIYRARRRRLADDVGSGVVFFPGNRQSPINFADNLYPFRQDSSFLYFWGLDTPDLGAVIDIDACREIIFGNDMSPEESVWSGEVPSLSSLCEKTGVTVVEPSDRLESFIRKTLASGRNVHVLPPYRADNVMAVSRLLETAPEDLETAVSLPLIRAVVAQRSIKDLLEVEQIEQALDVTCAIHRMAMKMTSPGRYELEVVSAMESMAYANGGCRMAYPTIFTVKGDILHNRFQGNIMKQGQLAVNDSGVESPMHYASDITRTIPVGGVFSGQQKDIYSIVLEAQKSAIQAIRPGISYRSIHKSACRSMATGLKALGLMTGDTDEAVEAGAHALFFPHGLGHMLGLDVHDMENFGEDHVGYTDVIKRSGQFGTRNLRLARKLETGFVVTVEPGLYFIPQLIDKWKDGRKLERFIDYAKVESYKGFGGIRIEDNVLVTEEGSRILGKPIPKSIEALEAHSA